MRGREHKSIAGPASEPLFELVRHAFWIANKARMLVRGASARDRDKIADGWVALAGELDDFVAQRPHAANIFQFRVRKRLVDTLRGEVEIQHLREQAEG